MVGAKKLGAAEDIDQHIAYCMKVPSTYFIATDGNVWELYDAFKKVKPQDKLVVRWVIAKERPGEVIRKALTISNISEFGKTDYSGEARLESTMLNHTLPQYKETFIEASASNRSPPTKPRKLVIEGEELPVHNVREVLIQTAEWLIRKGKLKLSDIPVQSGPLRYIVNAQPFHKSGKNFFDDHVLSNNIHLEVHGSHQAIESNAKALMERYGYKENSIIIEWNKGGK